MDANRISSGIVLSVVRWTSRILAAALFFFWGAFFVEHLEWLSDPAGPPPWWVLGLMALHALMLVGLIVGLRWERVGAALTLATATPFFYAAAGPYFLPFLLVTSLPPLLWLLIAWLDRRRAPASRFPGAIE
ncbi:MAG: hypothetical protein U0736_03325 [Gemmataceae bacterium]